ncbi:hypothetical protein [Sagittula stellata]
MKPPPVPHPVHLSQAAAAMRAEWRGRVRSGTQTRPDTLPANLEPERSPA